MTVEQLYRYRHPSVLGPDGLRLATSGGPVEHPYFFDGLIERPPVVAAGLLAVARVARTRFFTPPGMLAAILRAADPIVTSDGAMLRFESLSADCGVYARLDVLPDGLGAIPRAAGTTNVDFNGPMRDALAGLSGPDPMHLSVGDDEVRVRTLDAEAVERRVPLPGRWVRSLAELNVIARALRPAATYPAAHLRRLLQTQARGARSADVLHVVPGPGGPRLASRPAAGSVAVAGLDRLRPVEPLLRHATTVRAFGLGTGSAWLLEMPTARLTVMLSPAVSRGFSGEGGLLSDGVLDDTGFDLADGTTFERRLPLDARPDADDQPRLRAARALVDSGAVVPGPDHTIVTSGGTAYVVRRTPDGERCTCAWFATHGLGRGPCKHILAARQGPPIGGPS
ncbi:SWIM zinc finger domain-containing protein [Actinoplanes bogorensis]|uniref:SWIM zinc finger domain-containing protein n=1 Tax=Paractinoplanes bogorensis TaxID=1610840 RepID=A0ABS5Z1M3_9ACTN|nr:SWIM zinc finger family protein [Actinoplanes bogorensis]MBU2669590.1 SWIM zinc finger domain-containing protein [Actinoplanes bogorensis]